MKTFFLFIVLTGVGFYLLTSPKPVSEPLPAEPEPTTIEEPKAPDKPATKPKLDPVKDNPNNCDLVNGVVWSDYSCHPKVTTEQKANYPIGCENYRSLVSQYAWNVDIALLVMSKESGCNPNAVSPTNDHGLFQLNGQPVYDPAKNVAIAYQKYVGGRVGSNNWSAWYAVCTPGNNPQPKYAGVHCQ